MLSGHNKGESAIFLSIKNDVSFIVGASLNLYEPQSSRCKNLSLRDLIYFSTLYQTYVKERRYNLYGSWRILLPFPNLIVFSNGEEEIPDESEMCLSEAFLQSPEEGLPSVECRVKIRNINRGHNQELMKKCRKLWEYAEFIGCIRTNQSNGMKSQNAVSEAMDTCIKQGILAEIPQKTSAQNIDFFHAAKEEKAVPEQIAPRQLFSGPFFV